MAAPAEAQAPAAAAVDTSGRRRWARGEHRDDWTYYTFAEFVAFVQATYSTDAETARAHALGIWPQCLDEAADAAVVRGYAEQVRALPVVAWEAFPPQTVLLESAGIAEGPLAGPPGGCLRAAGPDGGADCWGGVWPQSVLSLEVVKTAPSLQVHIRSLTGACLHASGQQVSFAGAYEQSPQDPAAVFELLRRDGGGDVPLVSLVGKGSGCILGTFIPRRPPVELARNVVGAIVQQQEQVAAAAVAAAAEDGSFRGRRRHKQDVAMQYYTFEEMALYVQRTFQTGPEAALQLAKPLWLFGCVQEAEDDQWNVVEQAEVEAEDVDM